MMPDMFFGICPCTYTKILAHTPDHVHRFYGNRGNLNWVIIIIIILFNLSRNSWY